MKFITMLQSLLFPFVFAKWIRGQQQTYQDWRRDPCYCLHEYGSVSVLSTRPSSYWDTLRVSATHSWNLKKYRSADDRTVLAKE